MHPALMIAVMEERDRELARRTKHAWKQPPRATGGPATRRPGHGGRRRLSAAIGRLAFFG